MWYNLSVSQITPPLPPRSVPGCSTIGQLHVGGSAK